MSARAIATWWLLLEWLRCWGYSASAVLTILADEKKTVVGKLEKAGLIVPTRTSGGGIARGTPKFYYTLTACGLRDAESMAESRLRYPEKDRYRVNQSQIRHYLIAQTATARALSASKIVDYLTERQIDGDGDHAGIKRPDVVWILPCGKKVGVEIELSAKWGRQLDQFVAGIAWALAGSQTESRRFERIVIISDAEVILNRYRKAMQPNAALPLWRRSSRQRWEIKRTVTVPTWLISRVHFALWEAV